MRILVVNCGSSTLKFQLIDSETEEAIASGLCERIGLDGSITYKAHGEKYEEEIALPDHGVAIKRVLDMLLDEKLGVLKSLSEINAVGHRLVHGGEKFSSSVVITEEIIKEIESCNDLAPLHNPANLLGVRACQKVMPGVPNVAVFDTAFHQTMPKKAYLYGLGSGASISAIKDGKSVDTSMGMTPLEGLVMGTRSGDMDPAILEYICAKENISVGELTTILNKKSGALGLSGISSDYRDLLAAAENGDENAENALEVVVYRIVKYIGAYFVALGGVDAIALTAGVGENSVKMRERILSSLGALGIVMNPEANAVAGEEILLTKPESRVPVWAVPTNEELAIARETVRLV